MPAGGTLTVILTPRASYRLHKISKFNGRDSNSNTCDT